VNAQRERERERERERHTHTHTNSESQADDGQTGQRAQTETETEPETERGEKRERGGGEGEAGTLLNFLGVGQHTSAVYEAYKGSGTMRLAKSLDDLVNLRTPGLSTGNVHSIKVILTVLWI
jgi:hypothetical protein